MLNPSRYSQSSLVITTAIVLCIMAVGIVAGVIALTSSLSERRRSVSIAGLDCQIQAKTRQKLAGNRQIWQSDKA